MTRAVPWLAHVPGRGDRPEMHSDCDRRDPGPFQAELQVPGQGEGLEGPDVRVYPHRKMEPVVDVPQGGGSRTDQQSS